MHYFSYKFSKIAKRWSLNLQYWWPEIMWFDQIAGCDESELQKSVVTSFLWR